MTETMKSDLIVESKENENDSKVLFEHNLLETDCNSAKFLHGFPIGSTAPGFPRILPITSLIPQIGETLYPWYH